MEQTAVEWLIEQLKEYDFAHIKDDENYIIKLPAWVLSEKQQQAKAMEQDSIIQAYSNGWHDGQDVILNQVKHIDLGGDKAGREYFNETYKTEDNGE